MAATALDVYLEPMVQPIGRLTSDDGLMMRFSYLPAAFGQMPLSLSLPVREEPYGDAECRGFFSNLLFDSPEHERMTELYELNPNDVAGLLYHIGRDCPGAVSCVPVGAFRGKVPGRMAKDYDILSDAELAEIMRSLHRNGCLPDPFYEPSPLAGTQGKIAVLRLDDGRFALPKQGSGAPTGHILKVPRAGKVLVDRELALSKLARSLFIHMTVPLRRVESDGVFGLLTFRTDRHISYEGLVTRIHQEDFAQALGMPPSLKYEYDAPKRPDRYCAANIRRVLDATDIPGQARMAFLRTTIFNLATGNTDNHAKNHGLLYRQSRPELAPLYDLAPGLPGHGKREDFAFKIGQAERVKALTPDDLTEFLHDLGFSRGVSRTVKAIRKLLRAMGPKAVSEIGSRLDEDLTDTILTQLQIISDALQLPLDPPELDYSPFV